MLREASCEIVSNEESCDCRTAIAGGFCFGPFVLIPQRQMLLRSGVPVRIGGRALEILTLLVERAGEVLCKQEIIARVWAGIFVDESNLKVNIAAIRRAIDDPSAHWSCIATIVGRGYRFVAPVRRIPAGEEECVQEQSDWLPSSREERAGRPQVTPIGNLQAVHRSLTAVDVSGGSERRVLWIRVLQQDSHTAYRHFGRRTKRLHQRRRNSRWIPS